MNIHPDFEELFRLLEEHHVDYMIVGGYAVAFHGHPRFTKDIDVFFESSQENIARLRAALVEFGFEYENLPAEAFATEGSVLTFGVVPTRVDLLNRIDGIHYVEAKPNVVRGRFGNVGVSFIGREDLIRNKRATRRTQDKADAESLDNAQYP